MKRLLIAILPLFLLLIVVGAQRITTKTEHGTVISLGESSAFNSDKPALTALVSYLKNHPNDPVTVIWREELAGNGITEHRATYTPYNHQLIFLCAGQRDMLTGITITGMQKALAKGDRGATFANAKIASAPSALFKTEWAVHKPIQKIVRPYF